MMNIKCAKALGTFVGGVLFGTAGISVLKCSDAKKAYTHCTAAVLRGKDSIVKTVNVFKENCEDIYADAIDLNDERYEMEKAAKIEEAKAIVEEYNSEMEDDIEE